MAQISILSEIKPLATNQVNLFVTVPGQTATGTVFVMNQGNEVEVDRVSVALVPNGNLLTANSWICFETMLHYGHSLYLQQIYLGSQDRIIVSSENGTSNFIFTGTASS